MTGTREVQEGSVTCFWTGLSFHKSLSTTPSPPTSVSDNYWSGNESQLESDPPSDSSIDGGHWRFLSCSFFMVHCISLASNFYLLSVVRHCLLSASKQSHFFQFRQPHLIQWRGLTNKPTIPVVLILNIVLTTSTEVVIDLVNILTGLPITEHSFNFSSNTTW